MNIVSAELREYWMNSKEFTKGYPTRITKVDWLQWLYREVDTPPARTILRLEQLINDDTGGLQICHCIHHPKSRRNKLDHLRFQSSLLKVAFVSFSRHNNTVTSRLRRANHITVTSRLLNAVTNVHSWIRHI
jgi:hypothetical protein